MSILKHTKTTSTDDSDVIVLTCPERRNIEILSVHIRYTSTVVPGNRQLKFSIHQSDATLVMDFHAGAVQAASLTYDYTCGRGVYRETAFINNSIHMPIPFGTVLLPGWYLRIYDSAAIDAAADDIIIDTIYREMDRLDGEDVS